jgi:UDP-N-acetylglucosamine:LPS N-acetylglucosamine transferase
VVAIDMGYGHLRPARTLARALGTSVLHADRAPLADEDERQRWATTRRAYESMTRVSGIRWVGEPLRALLNSITDIPALYPFRDLSAPTLGVKLLEHSAKRGLGRSIVSYLQEHDLTLVTTFYSPAIFSDFHGYDRIYCVVTDSDINRVWAPLEPRTSKIRYLAPSGRVVRRLRAYGVPQSAIELTGFPLPESLVGTTEQPTMQRNLLRRLVRLDPKGAFRREFASDLAALGELPEALGAPHLVFAVGGTGAQADLPALFLPSLKPLLERGKLRLTLVAGIREDVRARFEEELEQAGLSKQRGEGIEILHDPDIDRYFDRFDELLGETDLLWTKPSELVFYAGLGIPLLLAPPVGIHESYNLRFVRENGAGLKQRDPRVVGDRLQDHLSDGNLAAAAWAGYRRLPNRGTQRIVQRLLSQA